MMISRRTSSLLGAVAVAALAFSGCGSSSSSKSSSSTTSQTPQYGATTPAKTTPATTTPAPAASATGTAGTPVKLSADPTGALKFNVSTLHAKAGAVTLQLVNPPSSGVPHGIAVQGHGVDKDSKIVQAGNTTTVTANLKAGTYDFYCPVPGHKAAGMVGKLIVA